MITVEKIAQIINAAENGALFIFYSEDAHEVRTMLHHETKETLQDCLPYLDPTAFFCFENDKGERIHIAGDKEIKPVENYNVYFVLSYTETPEIQGEETEYEKVFNTTLGINKLMN